MEGKFDKILKYLKFCKFFSIKRTIDSMQMLWSVNCKIKRKNYMNLDKVKIKVYFIDTCNIKN